MKYHDYSKQETITLDQYLYLKTLSISEPKLQANISEYELKLFSITRKKGWWKKNKKKEIDVEIARKAARSFINKRGISKQVKEATLNSLFYGEFSPHDDKFVYLLINENGHSKIGVSKDPVSRAKGLQNGSGYDIHEIYYWAVKDSAFRIESHLHKNFKEDRINGEWFASRIEPDEIEDIIPCEFVCIQ